MVKVARLASVFGATGAAASLMGWAVSLPFFSGLAAWLLILYVVSLALAIALDDALIAYIRCTPESYYGALGLVAGSIALGGLLIWLV
jgi:hypothetical protein